MTEENKELAAEQAKQAVGQGKAAAKNTGKALRAVAEPVAENVADGARDAVQKAEATADDAVNVMRKVDPKILSRISGDTGVAFLALSASLYSAAIAFNKFRTVYQGRSQVIGR